MRLIYLQCRNLGDAVIGTGLVEALPNHIIEVFTRPAFAQIYQNNPHIAAVHTASFPMGTNNPFGIGDFTNLLDRIFHLRRRKFDAAVTVTGDIREIILGWLIVPRGNYGVKFASGNAFARSVRKGGGNLLCASVTMPSDDTNMYSIISCLADLLGATKPARQCLYDAQKQPLKNNRSSAVIGLHLSAGQACRLWPIEHWRQLIAALRARGKNVVIFAAPSERTHVEESLKPIMGSMVEISTGDLSNFFERLRNVRALVGLDSFSTHAAQAVGTPAVFITGPTPAELFSPPDAAVIAGGPGLPCYPCYNKPTCVGRASQYACMARATVQQVLIELEKLGAL